MRITLNLATRPYANIGPALKRLRIAMAVLAVVGIGLGWGLHSIDQQAKEARSTEDRVQKQIDAINLERKGYMNRMHEPVNDALLKQVTALNQLFDEKTFSWTLAMEDLETVLPGGVQVTSLDPTRDAKTGRITLKLRVVGPRDHADDLVENLERSKHFLMPHIVDESTESNTSANQRVEPMTVSSRFTFEILAEYNPTAPEEVRKSKEPEAEKREAEVKQEKKAQAAGGHPRQGTFKPLPAQLNPAAHPLPAPVAPGTVHGLIPPPSQQRLRPNGGPGPLPNPNAGGPR
ncbi:MAG: fimbrial assembly protein [Terracidiphilus sp.]